MANYSNHRELITKYLEGSLSREDQLEFEIQIQNDPLLKDEFEFQKDVIDALRNYRKNEIKNRLNNINIGNSSGFNLLNIAASVTISSFIAIGTYLYLSDHAAQDSLQVVDLANTPNIENSSIADLPEKPKVVELQPKSLDQVITEVKGEEKATKEAKEIDSQVTASNKKINTPNVILPNIVEEFETMDPLEVESDLSNNSSSFESIKNKEVLSFEIEKIENSEYLHYQFYQGKLYLYGEFNDNPYEIIELKSGNKRKVFLNYNEDYFLLKTNQRDLTPLKAIKDPTLIEELNILKSE